MSVRLVAPTPDRRGGPQPALFDPTPINARQFDPVQRAVRGAATFTHGAHSLAGLDNTQVDSHLGFRVAQAYRTAQKNPPHPTIAKSYAAFRKGVNAQYAYMTAPVKAGGMGITHETVDKDPYRTSEEMARDVANGRIRTLATTATGPTAGLSPQENDRFRAVHDVFGHAATGRGFSRHGEEAAYLSHRQMFSRAAQQALASETRGQNSYLNFRREGFPAQDRLVGLPPFAQRKR